MRPGDAVYVDLDGNGVIDANDMSRDYGYTDDPQYMAGLNLGFSWKNWEFSTQWTAAWNVSRLISDVFRQPFYQSSDPSQGGLLAYHLNHTWTEEIHRKMLNIHVLPGPTPIIIMPLQLYMKRMQNIFVWKLCN